MLLNKTTKTVYQKIPLVDHEPVHILTLSSPKNHIHQFIAPPPPKKKLCIWRVSTQFNSKAFLWGFNLPVFLEQRVLDSMYNTQKLEDHPYTG